MNNLKWAIIGPGSIANEFAAALDDIGGTLYAVGSRTLESPGVREPIWSGEGLWQLQRNAARSRN